MILYPTIELSRGRCVSLRRGRLEEPEIWHVDPVEHARSFAAAGAEWMHVTDIDAVAGTGENRALIGEIIRHAGIPVQVAGGIRSRARIDGWLEAGAGRVVVGTAAVIEPDMLHEAAKYHPDAVVLAVDVFRGRVMIRGWQETTAFEPESFLSHFHSLPLAGVLVTDIDADVGDTDATLGLIAQCASLCRVPVIASGMIRTLDDIARLKYVGNVAGALLGRALFRRSVDLTEALEAAAEPPERRAQFL